MEKLQNNIESLNEEKRKEMIKSIENLKIGSKPKANIILIFLGLKPATELEISSHNDSAEKVINVIENIGLKVKIKSKFKRKDKDIVLLSVADNQENLDRLEQIDPSKNHEEYGRLMGYPETAIDAFLHKEKRLDPENYLENDELIFFIAMSKENWEEEIKTLKKWSDAIKEQAPDLYVELKGK